MVKYSIRLKDNLPYSKRKLSNGAVVGVKDFLEIPKDLWQTMKARDGGKPKGEFEYKTEK